VNLGIFSDLLHKRKKLRKNVSAGDERGFSRVKHDILGLHVVKHGE
jgi:hypothetical protein